MVLNLHFIKVSAVIPILLAAFSPMASIAQWTALNSGTNESLNEIIFPAPDTGYVAGANGTLLRTFTGGDQWTALDIGSTQHLNDIYFLNTQTGYVVGDSGLFSITFDAGEHWNTSYLSPAESIVLSSVCFTSMLTGYVGGRSDIQEGIIYKTVDGGITWEETFTPESLFDRDYKRIVFPTPDIGYALTRGMCIKTIDGGDHWFVTDTALVSSGNMFSLLEDAYFFSADTGYIVGWYNGFNGYTVNGGENWTDQMTSNNQWYSIDFPSRQTGYLAGWGQLMKTTDGGHTWEEETSELIANNSIYSMDFTDDNTGYVCGAGGVILKTTNGGITRTHDFGISSALQVYPNPTTGLIHIEMNRAIANDRTPLYIEVFTLLGEKVWQSFTQIPASIQLWDLPKGIYLLTAMRPEGLYSKKIILY